jgi:hypothetical protein
MKDAFANNQLNELKKSAAEKFDAEKIVEELKSVREKAKVEADPAIVKILRLTYEYIEENEDFDLGYCEEEEIGDMTDFEYLMELIINSQREANREEIRAIRDRLMEELY